MSLQVGTAVPDRWSAAYAWSVKRGGPGLEVRFFRRCFTLEAVPETFLVHVSADSRYRLFVNGRQVGLGPLKGTLQRYYYETYDLASCLRIGKNVLAAEVRWFGENTPTSEVHSARPGFLFQGPASANLDTPGEWRVWVDQSIQPDTTPYISNAHNFLGYWEILDGRMYPHGWRDLDFDDTAWKPVSNTGPADVAGFWGESHRYQTLIPRSVSALVEEPHRFLRTVRDRDEIEHLFGPEPRGWSLLPGESGELVLDVGHLTTGYPELLFKGGAGRTVEIIYGECLLGIKSDNHWDRFLKGVRNDWSFGGVYGYQDTVILPGQTFAYEPFHWRTFWFIKLRVSPGDEPFCLKDISYRFTTFPQTLQATFDTALPDTAKMWEISWRSLQLCAHETYEDCPYFEQLNYIADSRLQALCSLVLCGQTELPKRTIQLYYDSVRSDGLVQSRVPSTVPQILPYFALIWILMVKDYWQWVGEQDRPFVCSMLNVVDSVLVFFRQRLSENGFVGQIPPWSMVDRAPGWRSGEPPAVAAGQSTYLTCLFIHAVDAAVRLHEQVGVPSDAGRWRALANRLRHAVRDQVWSPFAGLFLEGPGRAADGFSQHSQALAILSSVATREQSAQILRRLAHDPTLYRMKFMQSFYLARALEKAGGYVEFSSHVLALWREAMSKNLSTWPEYPDPTRSDCHAWSSWIAADFVTCILGIRPLKPGFAEILIAPHTETTGWAKGSAPTPFGLVQVEWHRESPAAVVLDAVVPDGVPAEVRLPGRAPVRYNQGGKIHTS